MNAATASTGTVALTTAAETHAKSVMEVDNRMIGLTWVTFIIAALLLYKIAWKPILSALDKRESDIRRALDGAEKANKQMAEVEVKSRQVLADASAEAGRIIEESRKAAAEIATGIQAKAREEAQTLLTNAEKEIGQASEKAVNALRRESAALAVELAGNLIRKKTSDADKQALMDDLLREI